MSAVPKIHKESYKMRPIVSNINYNENKHSHFQSSHNKNSFGLVKKFEYVELQDNGILVSFDVAALFPSIDTRENHFFYCYKFVFERKFVFQFKDKFYKQKNGTSIPYIFFY